MTEAAACQSVLEDQPWKVVPTQLEAVLSSMREGLMLFDAEGRLLTANPAALRIFGFESLDECRRQLEELPATLEWYDTGGRPLPVRQRPLERVLRGQSFSGLEVQVRRSHTGAMWVGSFGGAPVPSPEGEASLAVLTFRDVTAQKQEQWWCGQLSMASIDTERAVASSEERRTTQLIALNTELELRNRDVERASQLKSEFLASVSHELCIPLNSIMGFSDLLAEETPGQLNDKQRRFLGHIRKAAQRLLKLINQILDLSKIEAGRLELRCESFHLAAVLSETLALIGPLASAKGVAVHNQAPPDFEVFADRVWLGLILNNLLSNAIKFTAEGGEVRIECAAQDGFVSISVSDSGVGIPPEEHQAIFEEFYQVGATTQGAREGVGLGLAIARRLVHQHGGRIWVESQPSLGSRFSFTLPRPALGPPGQLHDAEACSR